MNEESKKLSVTPIEDDEDEEDAALPSLTELRKSVAAGGAIEVLGVVFVDSAIGAAVVALSQGRAGATVTGTEDADVEKRGVDRPGVARPARGLGAMRAARSVGGSEKEAWDPRRPAKDRAETEAEAEAGPAAASEEPGTLFSRVSANGLGRVKSKNPSARSPVAIAGPAVTNEWSEVEDADAASPPPRGAAPGACVDVEVDAEGGAGNEEAAGDTRMESVGRPVGW